MESLLDPLGAPDPLNFLDIIASLCASFSLSMVLAWVYRWTHQGFSYSRSFLHTLVLGCIAITIMIMAIGGNLAQGLGIFGAMAFVRFRTPIRDPRDIVFLFAALAVGVSSGAQVFELAIVGTLFFCAAVAFLSFSPFGSRREFEGLLRFILPNNKSNKEALEDIFEQYTGSAKLLATRDAIQGEALEYSYQVTLLDPSYKTDLVDAISKLEDSMEVSMIMQRTTVEV